MKRFILSAAVAATGLLSANAEITLPEIFSDNMVLQQKSDARIWGWASPGAKISVRPSWCKKSYSATGGQDGRWELTVPTPEASYTRQTIRLKGDGSDLRLDNILIAEVWLC